MSSLPEIFSPDGPLARTIDGYRVRAQQVEMAERIAGAIHRHDVFIAEAGTGTGKTFAYLVPALLSGEQRDRVDRHQDAAGPVVHMDLPSVRRCSARACSDRAAQRACQLPLPAPPRPGALADGRFASREGAAERSASLPCRAPPGAATAELRRVSGELAAVEPRYLDHDSCLGQDCPDFDDCFVVKARAGRTEADLVVVNHHLLFADLRLQHEGMAEILPAAHAFILDEAHQIPEVATCSSALCLSTRSSPTSPGRPRRVRAGRAATR